MTLKDRVLNWLGLSKPEPALPSAQRLSKHAPRHYFVLLQARSDTVFKVMLKGKLTLLDLSDWKVFLRLFKDFCESQDIQWSQLERGEIGLACEGYQMQTQRGIKYVWSFRKL